MTTAKMKYMSAAFRMLLESRRRDSVNDQIMSTHASFTRVVAFNALRSLHNRTVHDESGWEGISYDYDESEEWGNSFGLDSLFPFGIIGPGGNDDFDLGALMEDFTNCGVDPIGMMTKLVSVGIDADQDQGSIWKILLALKDDDEDVCTEEEVSAVVSVSREFWECASPSSDLDWDMVDSQFNLILNGCEEFSKLLEVESVLDFDLKRPYEDKSFAISGRKCLQSALGDNIVGNFFRHMYNNIDQVIQCEVEFGDKLPKCIITTRGQENSIGDEEIAFPLSLEKKMTCLAGSYENVLIDSICATLYNGLDDCLPNLGDDFDDERVSSSCRENDVLIGKQDLLFGMDTSIITDNRVPDFCSNVFKESGMDIIQLNQRLDYFNKKREYGWVSDSYEARNEDSVLGASPTEWENGAMIQVEPKGTSYSFVIGVSAAAVGLAIILFATRSIRRQKNYFRLNAGGENEMVNH